MTSKLARLKFALTSGCMDSEIWISVAARVLSPPGNKDV